MKKNIIYLLLIILLTTLTSNAYDGWEQFSGLDKAWDGQKSITDKEFEEAINTLEKNKLKKEQKQRKKKARKISGGGTSLHNELQPDKEIKELSPLKKETEGERVLSIPVKLRTDEGILEEGFYSVEGKKENDGTLMLLFYQAHYLKGKTKAFETTDDNNEDSINFVRLIPYNDYYVKILYGSLDYNAYAFVRINEE